MEAIIALGSNLGQRERYLEQALLAISIEIGTITAQSSFHNTKPEFANPSQAASQQGDFINAVICVESMLPAKELLNKLRMIEDQNGRIRDPNLRYSARTLDLDLIAYADLIIEDSELCLPHAEMAKRSFVLAPLVEIRPDWIHPLLRKSAKELYQLLSS